MSLLLLLLAACSEPLDPPWVGDCAIYPQGSHDYGDLGIGTCLSGPVALDWTGGVANPHLLVANSNPYLDFTGGSLLSVDFRDIPLDGGRVRISDLEVSAVDLPHFVGDMALVDSRNLAILTSRFSDGARTREHEDRVHFVDLADPGDLAEASVAQDGASELEVEEDPNPVVYDIASGRAFVANTTSGTISVLDMLSDPVEVLDAVPEASVSGEIFVDGDSSGSRVEVADLKVTASLRVKSETWNIRYIEGTTRLWLPTPDGITRIQSQGDGIWSESTLGIELGGADDEDWDVLEDPQYYLGLNGPRMALVERETGELRAVTAIDGALAWEPVADPLLEPREGAWDEVLGGPMVVVHGGLEYLFYDGTNAAGIRRIGLATSTSGVNFDREGEAVLQPGAGDHDAMGVADPHVLFDDQAGLWRMYYSAYDGVDWTIGRASSADLLFWEADSEPVFESLDSVASPVVVYGNSEFRMWMARASATGWSVEGASSADGLRWTDLGVVAEIGESEEPPGPGVQAQFSQLWSVQGDQVGTTGVVFEAGEPLVYNEHGWALTLSAGAWLSPSLDEAANGVSASTWLPEEDRVYASLLDENLVPRIGLAQWIGSDLTLEQVVLEGRPGFFDEDGVLSPVVWATDAGYTMLYAGISEGVTRIGRALSTDGISWEAGEEPVLAPGEEWDSLSVVPGSVVEGLGNLSLWYSGSDGSRTRIGLAESTDGGESWTRVTGDKDWIFEEGKPGDFDDGSVSDPLVIQEGDTEHLWYTGFDGTQERIGYAWREGGGAWVRPLDADEEVRVVLEGRAGEFDLAGARRPVVVTLEDGSHEMLYTGIDTGVARTGLAVATLADQFYRDPRRPTTGDRVRFESHPGDRGGQEAAPLSRTLPNGQAMVMGQVVAGFTTSGDGINEMLLDEERGFLYLASSSSSYLYVVDVRDDSTEHPDHLYGIEAVLVASSRSGAIGFRGLALSAEGNLLYALNDSPESVMIFDLSELEDDAVGQIHRDAVIGALPSPRGLESDAGLSSFASVGPSRLVRSGDLLYVSHFNDNSIGVYDLRLGVYGAQVDEIVLVGENPHALSISPDGRTLVVAAYVGEAQGSRRSSTLALVDIDPDSPDYLEVQAWIVND